MWLLPPEVRTRRTGFARVESRARRVLELQGEEHVIERLTGRENGELGGNTLPVVLFCSGVASRLRARQKHSLYYGGKPRAGLAQMLRRISVAVKILRFRAPSLLLHTNPVQPIPRAAAMLPESIGEDSNVVLLKNLYFRLRCGYWNGIEAFYCGSAP
jgi:hypothetical protein